MHYMVYVAEAFASELEKFHFLKDVAANLFFMVDEPLKA